jgi:hypothetical protein
MGKKNLREAVLFTVNEVMSNILELQELDATDTLTLSTKRFFFFLFLKRATWNSSW